MKVCSEPGCPTLTDRTRCAEHERVKDQARGSREQRGYGYAHKKRRASWVPKVAGGRVLCARCNERISPFEPWDLDHTDDRSGYLGPSHAACNRSNRWAIGRAVRMTMNPGAEMNLTLVEGAPCSGKTTYVQQHKQLGDVVLDYDAIAVALGSADTHDHPRILHPLIMACIDAVLERAQREPDARVWLIKCDPTPRDRALARTTVLMDASEVDCHARASEGRPASWPQLIRDWYARREGPIR